MEFLLSHLIIQWFDKKYNCQNSLVRQILNTFFKSFVLFSNQRCEAMMNALIKVIFGIFEARHQVLLEEKEKNNKKKRVEVKKPQPKKNAKKKKADDSSDDDDFSLDEDDDYLSDDSRLIKAQKNALLEDILKELDPIQITKVFLLLLSKEYIQQNAAKEFKLSMDFNVHFLLTVCHLNAMHFKKVGIVKEFISEIVDYVDVNQSKNWKQLLTLSKYLELNMKMLIQGGVRLKKTKESVDRLVKILREDE